MTNKSEKPFLEAIEQGQLSKIIALVKYGHNIHIKNTLGQNFLVYILQLQQQPQQDPQLIKNRFQIFEFLIANSNLNIHTFDHYGKNPFNWATNLNCTQEALYLLKLHPGDIDILARDQLGSCSLHYAVEHGNESLVHAIVNYLLRYRLRFDIKDAHGNTPEDLARKLGYDKISLFLTQACRSTVYMSREIPIQQVTISKLKVTSTKKSSASFNPSEYFHLVETRIYTAKRLNDWSVVTILRALKKKLNERKSNRLPDPVLQITANTSSIPSLPKILPIPMTRQAVSQPEQMLRLIELHISPSFRPSFTPIYQQSISSNFQRSSNGQCKTSQTSSSRKSSVLSLHKRDADLNQTHTFPLQEIQNRLPIPPVFKQQRRQSIITAN